MSVPHALRGAAVGLVVGVAATVLALRGTPSDVAFQAAQAWGIGAFGWFHVAAVAGVLVVVLVLALGPIGRLGLAGAKGPTGLAHAGPRRR